MSQRFGGISRRAALRGLSGATAAMALASGSRLDVIAQGATPATVPALFTEWASTWSTDPAPVATIYAADAVLEDVATGVIYSGADAIAAHIADVHAGLPDASFMVNAGFATDDHAALEYVFSGTYSGQLPGLPAGAGQSVSARGASLIAFSGGRIVREAHYYDAYGFLIQLGVLPAPEAAATPQP
jgi:steroid delta-isomerase-like uncharacterized protein